MFIAFINYAQCGGASREVTFTLTLWFGDKIDREYSIHLNSPHGFKLYDSMLQASMRDPMFRFKTDELRNGKAITEISGFVNNPME